MIYNIPSHLPELPVYKKAIEIFSLSRKISFYLSYDLSHLNDDGKEDEHIYFSGDIVQQSEALVPEILMAEAEKYSDKKHKHTAAVQRLTNLLYKNCSRLELSNSNGRDYIPILRKELKAFRKLQRNWMLTL
ncbi:MAG: hypothetical protein KC469_03515 [Flavobacteriaceae bacterium]|jgi:hypothetical protein|nr:hypothetical protein [Flavobacteriaceae bacterium]